MRNILQIMDYAAPYRGNFISSIECLEKHWGDKGNIVYLFPHVAERFPWVQHMNTDGKRLYFIDRSFFSKKILWRNIKLLNSIIENEEIDVIHTHFVAHNYSLFLFSKVFGSQKKIVANLHNHYQPNGRLALLKSWVMKHTVDFFIGDSESVSKSVLAIGVKKKYVKTVSNAVQFERLTTFENIDLSKSSNNPVVLMFGYPWFRKGVDIVTKTINSINRISDNKICLAIAMAGGQDEIHINIENTLGFFPNWIEFLPPREDLATYYNAADIFISAGREEGLSYSPIEAAYCKCLLICSNIPGNPLDIPFMPTYEVEDIDDLQFKIKALLHLSDYKKNEIKKKQREFVISRYNLDSWANDILKCYD